MMPHVVADADDEYCAQGCSRCEARIALELLHDPCITPSEAWRWWIWTAFAGSMPLRCLR